ncbi:hypothetical protein LCGC14_1690620 [marine sediment metagenome]|uniref:Sigma-54-dependent Fis family transcriptional regulator n=1 Tax=marine sediment metagenome TaxID=412755 RepID=A0A0F9I8I3_9ZZZZ
MNRAATVLVVEDDAAMRDSCAKLFRLEGYQVAEAPSAAEALKEIARRDDIDVVLTDLKMPGMDGVTLLKEIKRLAPDVDVVLMTGYGSIQSAVEAIKHGAADYITKPFDTNELLMTVGKIVQLSGLREEVSRLRSELRRKYRFDNIIGSSECMQAVYKRIEAARNSNSSVLICGDSGTGKELVAKAIHYDGLRAEGPFVPINCAAIPRDLIESELFGHKRGAFTGAVSDSAGLFWAANGGTLFLDEILDMPYATQAKLLRALQEKRIRRIGDAQERPIDVRVIASTNQDVQRAIRDSTFREDLYYRLSVIRIDVPPLCERREDIPALVRHFIDTFNETFDRTVNGISDEALDILTRHDWPGNVRELEGAVEHAFAVGKSHVIQAGELSIHLAARPGPGGHDVKFQTLTEAERDLLVQAMTAADGNKAMAARLLGISRPRLYKMIERHRLRD